MRIYYSNERRAENRKKEIYRENKVKIIACSTRTVQCSVVGLLLFFSLLLNFNMYDHFTLCVCHRLHGYAAKDHK